MPDAEVQKKKAPPGQLGYKGGRGRKRKKRTATQESTTEVNNKDDNYPSVEGDKRKKKHKEVAAKVAKRTKASNNAREGVDNPSNSALQLKKITQPNNKTLETRTLVVNKEKKGSSTCSTGTRKKKCKHC